MSSEFYYYPPSQPFDTTQPSVTMKMLDDAMREVERLRQQNAVLRVEVTAWREWRKLVVRYMTCEQPDPTIKIDALKAAIEATDAAKALEEP